MFRYIDAQIKLGRAGWDHFHSMIILALYNGLRSGEVLALKFGDINLDKRTIHVQRTITEHKESGYIKESTKNGGKRKIVMSKHVFDTINKIFEATLKKGVIDSNAFIFSSPRSGDPFWKNFITYRLDEMRYQGVYPKEYCFHTLRHSFASLYFKNFGTTHDALRRLRDLMGHSSVMMTEKYIHVYESQDSTLLEGLTFKEANAFDKARCLTARKASRSCCLSS